MTTAAQVKKDSEDPLRAALAEAIERHTAAQARAVAARAAKDGFWQIRADAEDAVASAEAALGLAQADAVDASISGRPFLSPQDAREKRQDAQDRLLAIEASEPRIGQEVIAADSALETARYVLKGKIADVVKSSPGVMKLLSDYETAQKSLAGMRRVLQLISGKNGLPASARHWYAERHWPVDMALEQKWRAAIDALKSDAHAALPE